MSFALGERLPGLPDDFPPVIDIYAPATWPIGLLSYLATHETILSAFEEERVKESPYPGAVDWHGPDYGNVLSEYHKVLKGLRPILERFALVGWHCSCLTKQEIDVIRTTGMQLPDRNRLLNRIDSLASQGVITNQIAALLKADNWADKPDRAERICFCFCPPSYTSEGCTRDLFIYWGGEVISMPHQNNLATGPVIRTIGIPTIIEAVMPVSHIRLKGNALAMICRRYLFSQGYNTTEHEWYDDESLHAILPAQILKIVSFPDAQFYELTGCADWHEKFV